MRSPVSLPARGAGEIVERRKNPLIERPPVEQRVGLYLHAGRQCPFLSMDIHDLVVGLDDDAIEWSGLLARRRSGQQALDLLGTECGVRDADYGAPEFAELLIGKGATSAATLVLVDEPDGAAWGEELGLHRRVLGHDLQHRRARADRLAGIRDDGGDHPGTWGANLD